MLPQVCVRDCSGTPLLWRCGAKATTKSGSGKPGPKGHAQKKIRNFLERKMRIVSMFYVIL